MSDSKEKSPRRKSKRRSSFAASRINVLQKGTTGEELYKHIDVNKSPEERLVMLSKLCLEYTLKKMKEKLSGCRDFDTYKQEVEEAVLRKIADMEANGMFKKATQKDRTVPNPINTEMDYAVEDLKSKIEKLKEESDKWDKLTADTEGKIAECEQKSKKIKLEMDIPDTVKSQAGQYLCNRLDYNSVLSDVDQSCKKTGLMIYEHAKVVGKLNTTFELLSSKINKRTTDMKELQNPVETPRRVIQSLLSFPTPR